MGPREIVEILVQCDGPVDVEALIEASIHLPTRSSRWVAAYRDASGKPVWRSTRLRDKRAAMLLAKRWEAAERRKRAVQRAAPPRKPTIRVRAGSAERELGLLTQKEVAMIMKISERAVREIERRVFEKLRRHPALRAVWREYLTGEIEETALRPPSWALSAKEIAAVYGLAETWEERQALRKLFALVN